MLTCELIGGLGNQLFQICTTLAFCIRANQPVWFSRIQSAAEFRPLYWNTFLDALRNYIDIGDLFAPSAISQFREISGHHDYHDIPIETLAQGHIRLKGYFQSYLYFRTEYSRIYEWLDIDRKKAECALGEHSRPTISMHFRVGDYVDKQCYHPILPIVYYERALRHIVSAVPGTEHSRVYVFFEERDIVHVQNALFYLCEVFCEMEFVFADTALEDWKQMMQMSQCNHHIIANSTFSWWGATFSGRNALDLTDSSKVICYPSVWYGHQLYYIRTEDLFPPGWTQISADSPELAEKCNCFL